MDVSQYIKTSKNGIGIFISRQHNNKMISLGVLCLVACAVAQPAVYVSRSSLDYPYYYYPMEARSRMLAIAPEKEGEEAKEVILSGMPAAPAFAPFPLMSSVMIEPGENAVVEVKIPEDVTIEKEKEPKEEETKEEEAMEKEESKEEEPKEDEPEIAAEAEEIEGEVKEEAKEEEPKPIKIIYKPTKFFSSLFPSLPQFSLPSFPQLNFPSLGSIFGKPRLETIAGPDASLVRYRVSYLPIMKEPLAVAEK